MDFSKLASILSQAEVEAEFPPPLTKRGRSEAQRTGPDKQQKEQSSCSSEWEGKLGLRAHSVVGLAEHFFFPKGHSLVEYSTHTALYNLLRDPEAVPLVSLVYQ